MTNTKLRSKYVQNVYWDGPNAYAMHAAYGAQSLPYHLIMSSPSSIIYTAAGSVINFVIFPIAIVCP